MGERKKPSLRLNFNRKVKLEFHGAKITSDAGLLAYREIDDAMGLTEMSVEDLADYRTGKNTQHTLLGMFRQAVSWDLPRRVVAKVEWHNGELFPRIGLIITNMTGRPNKIVHFYNRRGTAEQWIKEGENAVKWTRLSCRNFRDNQVRLQLFALAYNLGNFLRRLVLPRSIKHWSLTTLREKLIKIGAKIVHTSGYIYFQMAEVAVPRELFASILSRIGNLRLEVT